MPLPKIEIYESTEWIDDERRVRFRWRKRASNGRITATGEAHTRSADARRAARQNVLPPYRIVDLWREQ